MFCLFTPQSKAKVCWETVQKLREEDDLYQADEEKLSGMIKRVRFRNKKAGYLVEARDRFIGPEDISLREKLEGFSDPQEARAWLVENIKGLGFKEASHFLRNIGKGEDLAILDRHIMKNLKRFEVIEEIPKCLTRKRYLKIEDKMREFSRKIEIPLEHLDLLFWFLETGEIFK